MFLTSSNLSSHNSTKQMLTAVRPVELGMSDVNKIPFIEECGHDKNLAPNISQNFETTIVSHNNLESVRERVTQRTRPSHTEIDRKIEEEFSLELEDCSEPYTEDIRNVCRRILKRIKEAHEVEICVIFLPTREVVVIGEKVKTIENEIIQALAHLNLPKIHVGNTNTDFDDFPHVELLSKITKMLLESNEWISGESTFCELIVSAQDKDSGKSDGKSTYAVIPAHLILRAELTGSLTIGDGDIAQVLEKTREQGNQCKYIFTNDNQEEFDDFHPSPLIAYRYWDRRSTTEETPSVTPVTGEWEESSSFMNDVALLKFADDQQLATAEDTEVFPIPTRQHLELLAKRKQRIFVGDLEGTLIHNPETFGCVSKQYGLHLSFVITSKDSDGIVWELGKGSSGLIVSFKGRNGQLRPAGMLIGRLTAQVEGLDLSIYQAVVLSQALKEISDDYSLQISDYKLMQTCHQTSGTNTMVNQMAVETTVHASGDSELIGGKEVATNYPTAKLEMTNQRAVTFEDSRVSETSQLDSGASVDGRFAMMSAKSSSYDKLEQLLTGYVRPQGRQPDTAKLQQFLQAVTSEQRYELVTEARDGEFTVIHKAAFLDHVETISCILDSFTEEVRYKLLEVQGGMNGSTAIHFAALRGHAEAMRSMLDKVSLEHRIQLLDNRDKNNNTSLALALKHNNQQAADCIISFNVLGQQVIDKKTMLVELKGDILKAEQQIQEQEVNVQNAPENIPIQSATTEGHGVQLHVHGGPILALQLQGVEQNTQIKANTEGIFKNIGDVLQQGSLLQRTPHQTAELPEDCCINPEQEVDRLPTPAGNFPQVQLKEEVPRLGAKLDKQEVLNQQKIQQIEGGDVSRQREDFSSNKGPVDPTPGPSLELRDEEEDMLLESSCKEIAEATSHIGDDRHSVLPNKRTEGSLIDVREDVPPLPPRDYPTSSPAHERILVMANRIGVNQSAVTELQHQPEETHRLTDSELNTDSEIHWGIEEERPSTPPVGRAQGVGGVAGEATAGATRAGVATGLAGLPVAALTGFAGLAFGVLIGALFSHNLAEAVTAFVVLAGAALIAALLYGALPDRTVMAGTVMAGTVMAGTVMAGTVIVSVLNGIAIAGAELAMLATRELLKIRHYGSETPITSLSNLVSYLKEADHFKFNRGMFGRDLHFFIRNITKEIDSSGKNNQIEFFIYDTVSMDARKVVLTRNNFDIWFICEPDTRNKKDTLQYNIEKGRLVHIANDNYPTTPAQRYVAVQPAVHFRRLSVPSDNPSGDLVPRRQTGEGADSLDIARYIESVSKDHIRNDTRLDAGYLSHHRRPLLECA